MRLTTPTKLGVLRAGTRFQIFDGARGTFMKIELPPAVLQRAAVDYAFVSLQSGIMFTATGAMEVWV
jgi:hypothetical protein